MKNAIKRVQPSTRAQAERRTIIETLATNRTACQRYFIGLTAAFEREFQEFEAYHEPNQCTCQTGIDTIVTPDIIYLRFQLVDVATQCMKRFHLQRFLHIGMGLLLNQQFIEIDILMSKTQGITLAP